MDNKFTWDMLTKNQHNKPTPLLCRWNSCVVIQETSHKTCYCSKKIVKKSVDHVQVIYKSYMISCHVLFRVISENGI